MTLSNMQKDVLIHLLTKVDYSCGWCKSENLPRFSAGLIPGDMVPLPAQYIEIEDPINTATRLNYGGKSFNIRLTKEGIKVARGLL